MSHILGRRPTRIGPPTPGRRAAAALAALAALACAALTACSSADDQLQQFINEVKREPGGRVESLPELKPYQTFVYSAEDLRSPFVPSGPSSGSTLRPDPKRNREFLEQFSLDTLKMVGTLKLGELVYGLVETRGGLVNRVVAGNYIGQNDGKITAVTASKILIREIVPDGTGGYIERSAALALSN